jgi:hypothetical protein
MRLHRRCKGWVGGVFADGGMRPGKKGCAPMGQGTPLLSGHRPILMLGRVLTRFPTSLLVYVVHSAVTIGG